jgi:hypothetical protein
MCRMTLAVVVLLGTLALVGCGNPLPPPPVVPPLPWPLGPDFPDLTPHWPDLPVPIPDLGPAPVLVP